MDSLAPQPRNGRKSNSLLWSAVPFLLVACFSGFRATSEKDTATRQQTSFGIIGQCEHRGRGNENYCHYSFLLGDDGYIGVSQAGSGVQLGQTVVVYYDRLNPSVNSLEDFSEQSRKNMRFAYILLLALAAVVAFLIWNRTPYRNSRVAP
jgi:hypothetical protein